MSEDRRKLMLDADQAARRGDLVAAAACYRKLLAFTPTDLTLLQRLGDALARAGQDAEAREVLVRLSEEYWRGGFRSRALAVLRRASRLGGVQADLVSLLGERTLELGHVADAREPLLEAALAHEAANDLDRAIALYRQVATAIPRDLASRQALLRLAQRRKAPEAIGAARLELALATAVGGELPAAVTLLAQALGDSGDGAVCLARLPDLLKAFPRGVLPLVASRPASLAPTAQVAWDLMAAAFAAREGDGGFAARALATAQAAATSGSRHQLWIGRVQLDLGDHPAARATVLTAADIMISQGPPFPDDLTVVLASFLARDPNDRAVADRLQQIGPAPAPTGERPTPARRIDADHATPDPELPPEVQAAMTEAQSLIGHGLIAQARTALQSVDPAWRGHSQFGRLERDLAVAEAKSLRRPASAARKKPAEADEMLVVFEDDASAAEPKPTPAPTHSPPRPERPSSGQPQPGAALAPERPDFGALAEQIHGALGDEDYEMHYQMAIGLFEMGLEDQAIEMLERARRAPGRVVEVAVMLLQRRTARGEGALALQSGEEALIDAAGGDVALHGDLLAGLALAAHQASDATRAHRYLTQLEQKSPAHPALAMLREAIMAGS